MSTGAAPKEGGALAEPGRRAATAALLLASVMFGCGSVEEVDPGGLDRDAGASRPRAEQERDGPARDEGSGGDRTRQREPDRQGRSPRPRRGDRVTVTRVVDGDTIEVSRDGRILDVRLIGVDTPETVHPFEPVECYGPAASEFTRSQLEGTSVRLTYDVERRDSFGRTLAYVHKQGALFNEVLVARGFAQVATYPPNVKHTDRFLAAQRRARRTDRGLWDDCPREQPERPPAAAAGGARRCDPSYRGACIPSYPPDLDCDDVGATAFRSVGSDPHGFDGDGDGVACE